VAALGSNRLTILVNSVERAAEVSTVKITSADTSADFVSFADAAAGGGKDWFLELTAVQDPGSATSIWSLAWLTSGTEYAVIVRPYGNAVATATQPHFTGNVLVELPDDVLGGDADASTSQRWTSDMKWPFTAKPTKVVA
jgi:hypothetical protein